RAGDRRDARHPGRHREVATPLCDRRPAGSPRGGRARRLRDEWTISMTQDRSVEERISTWLVEEAAEQLPDRVLQAAFEQTRVERQRRVFPGRRDLRMLRVTPTLVAVGATAIVIAVVGVALFPRSNPSIGGGPSASPRESPSATAGASSSTIPIALGGDVAISRTVDGNTDIYLVPGDGGVRRRTTADPRVAQ